MIAEALVLRAVPGIPILRGGEDVAVVIADALRAAGIELVPGDVLAVTSKLLARAEGRFVDLAEVRPSGRAREIAAITGQDPRVVELVLAESVAVSRAAPNVLITRHRLGFVCANAGIDASNVGGDRVLLLPRDPDGSARRLADALGVGVVVTDSFGRPFRLGTVGVAIGVAGLPALVDQRGRTDLFGRTLLHTVTAFADQVAAAADLVAGQAAEGTPVVLVRGLRVAGDGRAAELQRPPEADLYAGGTDT